MIFICVCVCKWGSVHINVGAQKGKKWELDPLEIELLTAENHLTWVLRPKLETSSCAVLVLNH